MTIDSIEAALQGTIDMLFEVGGCDKTVVELQKALTDLKALRDVDVEALEIECLKDYEFTSEPHMNQWTIEVVRRTIAKIKAQGYLTRPVPKGYALVPIEPTTTIMKAMFDCPEDAPWAVLYKAMITAATAGEE